VFERGCITQKRQDGQIPQTLIRQMNGPDIIIVLMVGLNVNGLLMGFEVGLMVVLNVNGLLMGLSFLMVEVVLELDCYLRYDPLTN